MVKGLGLQILNEFASQSEHLKSIPPPVFLDIHRNSKQKEFFKSYDAFLRAALIGHGHPSPFRKIAKMALFNPCM